MSKDLNKDYHETNFKVNFFHPLFMLFLDMSTFVIIFLACLLHLYILKLKKTATSWTLKARLLDDRNEASMGELKLTVLILTLQMMEYQNKRGGRVKLHHIMVSQVLYHH